MDLRLNITVNWHWHALSPTLSQSLNWALFLASHMLYSFISCLSLCVSHSLSPSPSLHLQESRRACKRALIERNINLQVTNSSRSRAGAGVYAVNCCAVKPGPPRLLCPLRFPLALPWDPTTPQPEPQHTGKTLRANEGEYYWGHALALRATSFRSLTSTSVFEEFYKIYCFILSTSCFNFLSFPRIYEMLLAEIFRTRFAIFHRKIFSFKQISQDLHYLKQVL